MQSEPAPLAPAHRSDCAARCAAFTCCICGRQLGACRLGFRDRGPDRLHECAECWGEDEEPR